MVVTENPDLVVCGSLAPLVLAAINTLGIDQIKNSALSASPSSAALFNLENRERLRNGRNMPMERYFVIVAKSEVIEPLNLTPVFPALKAIRATTTRASVSCSI